MSEPSKPIRLSGHARQQLVSRGATEFTCTISKRSPLMGITYDHEVDALYIRFKETTVTTKNLGDGIAAD
jgi:hypothetical protein